MKAKMAGNATNCAKIRERMLDATSDALSGSIRAEFDAHVGECTACAKEFRHAQTLTQAISQNLSARLSAEASPQLVANVRRQISAESHRETWWRQQSGWLAAAGVCAALALLLLAVRSVREFNRPTFDHATSSIITLSTSKTAAHPHPRAAIEAAASAQPRKPVLAVVSHVSHRAPHRKAAEPEIIVEPGQMQAILRFAAAMQRGEIDGAQFLADQKRTSEPLEIEPLTVAPLGIKPLDADSAPLSSGKNSEKNLVIGRSD